MKIAILGTGLMGTAMAEAVISAGHQAIVFNRTAAKTAPLAALGATVATTPAEAIMAAEATILVLLDARGVKELLLNEQTKAVLRGKKLINATTTSAEEILEIANEVADLGGNLAEMTIQVGNDQLRSRQGNFAIGCPAADEQFWIEILLSIGAGAYRIGETGDATKAEAPTLFASMFATITAAHAVAISKKLNVPQEIYEPLVAMSVVGAEYLLPNLTAQNYDQVFGAVDSYVSGLTTAIQSAESVGMPTKVLKEMLELFETAARRGYGKKDGCAVLEVLLEPTIGER